LRRTLDGGNRYPAYGHGIRPLAARFRYYSGCLIFNFQSTRMAEPDSNRRSFFRVFTESGPLIALAVAGALLVGIAAPASAQFFNFGGPPVRQQPQQRSNGGLFGGGNNWFGGDLFAPFQHPAPRQRVIHEDYSRAPPPEKRETVPERNVLVLGDAMADWLAYGLEDAYADQPDIGIIRRHKTVSGLIKYQPKGEPADWAAAAKGILATEKPDAIVVMLGLNDRMSIREPAAEKSDSKSTDKRGEKKDARAKPGDKAKPDGTADATAKPDDKAVDTELPPDDTDGASQAPEKSARSPNGIYEFRDERWVELYTKKIEEMINVLKSKGVPVVWVGLPAIRGSKGTSDMLFLDSLYRDAAAKAGITYVDVWDGFVDEGGRYLEQGPDFEGQKRRLRSYDGVYFTQAGARKLAHYVEREVSRLLAARSGPITLPTEPATPDANAVPGEPAPRPLAGPILPLVASSVSTDQLLGGPGSRPAAVDPLAARTLVKGEPLSPPAGRADDFSWPRREVGREPAKGDVPVASVARTTTVATSPAAAPPKPKKLRPAQPASPSPGEIFGFGTRQPQAAQPARPQAPRVPRPPANVGRAAEAPGFFTR
jgi:hypothetical protein